MRMTPHDEGRLNFMQSIELATETVFHLFPLFFFLGKHFENFIQEAFFAYRAFLPGGPFLCLSGVWILFSHILHVDFPIRPNVSSHRPQTTFALFHRTEIIGIFQEGTPRRTDISAIGPGGYFRQ